MAGNSWQQPTAGEPSLGTPHYHEATDDSYVYTNLTPSANTWYSVDLSSVVPVGAKSATIIFNINNANVQVYASPSNASGVSLRNSLFQTVAGVPYQATVALNTSRAFYIAISNASGDIYINKTMFYSV